MPFLGGFVAARKSSSTKSSAARDSIKEHLRKVTSNGPSSISVKSGEFKDRPTNNSHSSAMDTLKRHSIGGKLLSGSDRRPSHSSPKVEPHRPAKLDIVVESPPLVSYNTPQNSSGALFSSQLQLNVIDAEVTVESFDVELSCSVTVKKPVHQHCLECSMKITSLKKVDLKKISEPLHLKQGEHRFPFSYLFGGHLPASTNSTLVKLEYTLHAVAKTATGESITFNHNIPLSRSVLPGNDKHSIRVFPPTNLTASVNLNPCVHPIGEFPVSLRLSGLTTKNKDSVVRWRLRKLNWRIEEHEKMISPACPKHAAKLGGAGKGILHEDIRTVGEADINYQRTPWKTDFDAGEVDAEFNCLVNPAKKPVCDVEAPNGLSITHNLIVEMVVAEEWCPRNKPNQVTPTGSARILRTQFHLLLTERPGLGISWDEETPPVYEDVPASPPHYQHMTDYDLAEIGGQMEEIHIDPNTNRISSTGATSSGGHARPSTSGSGSSAGARTSADIPAYSRGRFILDVDDLLSGPPENRRGSTTEEVQEDVQIGQADSR